MEIPGTPRDCPNIQNQVPVNQKGPPDRQTPGGFPARWRAHPSLLPLQVRHVQSQVASAADRQRDPTPARCSGWQHKVGGQIFMGLHWPRGHDGEPIERGANMLTQVLVLKRN